MDADADKSDFSYFLWLKWKRKCLRILRNEDTIFKQISVYHTVYGHASKYEHYENLYIAKTVRCVYLIPGKGMSILLLTCWIFLTFLLLFPMWLLTVPVGLSVRLVRVFVIALSLKSLISQFFKCVTEPTLQAKDFNMFRLCCLK